MFKRCFSGLTTVLAAGAFALSPGTAVAQHHGGGHAGHGGGGHGGGGHGGGFHGGGVSHGGGFHGRGVSHGGGFRGGYGYAHHGYGGYGYGRHYGGYGYGGWGYPGYYGGGGLGLAGYGGYAYSPGYYSYPDVYNDYYPDYSDTANYLYGGAVPSIDYGAAAAPANVGSARVRVIVPEGAKVWFNDSPTKQTGSVREFESPSLTAGRTFSYDVTARWSEGGQDVTRTRRVDVSANATATVDFTRPSPGENN